MKDFVIENGVLVSYKGSDESVEIPAEVEKIGAGAFKNNRKIKNVAFACKNLKSIEEDAFYDCASLEGIKIPEGTVQIARRAFMGCTNMEYIYIPSSVMIIGDIATESSVAVFGLTGSEAEKYAKKRLARFKTDLSNGLKLINSKKLEKENVTNQTFIVFGEEITVSSSLKRYHEILEYYNRRQEEFFNEMMTAVPKDYTFSKKVANGEPIFMGEREKTVKRLEKSGVYISEGELNSYTYDSMKLISDLFGLILKAYTELHSSALSDMKNQVQHFYDQAESQVTGLSYGHIGGGIGLVAYAFDDFFEKQKQRKKAYAVAEQQKTTYVNAQTEELNKTYAEFYNRFVPLYKKATDAHIEALLKCELDYYIKHGLIEVDIKDKYDVVKSSELMQGLYEKNSPNAEYVVALALNLYPMNISAHVYALEKELVCDGLEELRAFLGLNNRLQSHKDRVRNEKFEKISTKVCNCFNVSYGIGVIEENTFLTEDEIKKILTRYSVQITQSVKKITVDNPGENINVKEYCEQKLNNIISKDSWGFFDKYGVVPIKSNEIPQEAQKSFAKLVDYLEATINSKQKEKADQLKAAEEDLDNAKTLQDYEKVISCLAKIGGCKIKELYNKAVNQKLALEKKTIDKIKEEISKATSLEDLSVIEKKINSTISSKELSDALAEKKNEIQQKNKKRNKTLALIGSVAVVILAVVLFVSIETASKRNFKKMLENNAVMAESIDYGLKYDLLHGNSKDLKKAIAEKLNEYYKNNDVESAVSLIWEISCFLDSSIIDGWDIRASGEFTSWILENHDNSSSDIEIRNRTYAGGGLWISDGENDYVIYNSDVTLGINSDGFVVG
ncbi:MAG: leucine-rich repeat protein [Clostridia bacterium]|nr:leucine-rich repeat protein [Clostridia bacterium]